MPTANSKNPDKMLYSPKNIAKEMESIATIRPKKHRFRWIFILIVVLLIMSAIAFWNKPLLNLTSAWFNKPTNVTTSSLPTNHKTIVTPDPSSSTSSSSANNISVIPTATSTTSAPLSPSVVAEVKKSSPISVAVEIAKSYAAMSPTKAAAVLQTQSTEEIVYTMAEMSSTERARIWSKMNPVKVAEVSMQMKRHSDWTEQEITQLQKKIELIKQQELQKSPTTELALTYSQMPPATAAKLIDRMLQTDRTKTLSIVKNMGNTARTKILTIMAEDKTLMESAALIVKSLD